MTATPDATPDALRAARDALAACCKAAARPFLALPPLSMETQDALMQHFRLQAAPGTQSAPLYWACEHRFMSSLAAQIQMRAARACERMLSPAAAPGPAQPSQLALADAGEIERDLALTVWSARLPPELMQIEEQIAYQIRRALRSVEGQRPGLTPDQQPFTVRRLTLDITTLWDECAQPHGGGVLMFKRHAAALQTVLTDALRGVLEVLDSRYPIPVPRGLPQPEAPAAADTPAELAADDPLHALVLFTAPELADALSDRMAALRTRGRGSDLQPEVERLAAQRSASAPPPARFEPETLVRRTRTLFEELQQLPDLSRFDPSQVETLRLLSRVFLILMRDTKLHPELHTELEDLQAPLLRVALRDPEFFTDFDHPARRAVAQLIASGMNRRVGEAQRVEQLRAALRSAALLLAQARRQAPAQAARQADA
ncbi:MAG TPA: DUF1631 family protein, partial [Burkholderiaceae bacterium]|nr:DUF1631 family protein [Burkholderiaceae bacterium]